MFRVTEVGLTVIVGVVVAVPDTLTVAVVALVLLIEIVPLWVPAAVGA